MRSPVRAREAPSQRGERRLGAFLTSPTLLVILLVTLVPIGVTAYLSVHRASLDSAGTYVGLENYRYIAGDPAFRLALQNTAVFTIAAVAIELVLGLAVALVLNQAFKGRAVLRSIVLLPWAFPLSIAAVLGRLMLQDQTGIVSTMLTRVGLVHGSILSSPSDLLAAVIVVDVWTSTPFVAFLLLAGLQSIPTSVVEAAACDGAGPVRLLWHVILPLLRPAILVAVLFRTLQAWAAYDVFYVMGLNQINSISTYVYRDVRLSELQFAHGSAAAVFVFTTSLVIAVAFMTGLGRNDQGRASK